MSNPQDIGVEEETARFKALLDKAEEQGLENASTYMSQNLDDLTRKTIELRETSDVVEKVNPFVYAMR